jgi:3-isopropylmalate dehydrogenase
MANEYNLAIMPGDFSGKEVTVENERVIDAAASKHGIKINKTRYPNGGEHYASTGEILSDETVQELKDQDAIVFGAVGHPKFKDGRIERGILLKLRFDLDQYINLRPSKLYPGVKAPIRKLHSDLEDGFELVVVREGTNGLYRGAGDVKRHPVSDEVIRAWEVMDYTRGDVERTCRYAFRLAKSKQRDGKPMPVTLGFKSNVLKNVSAQLWQPIFERIAKEEFPDVPANYLHIDALNGPCLISNSPKNLGVIVTGNMFGDILTDLTASLFGGMGVGSSGCICPAGTSEMNPKGVSMFEPLHGSSPKDYGQGTVSPMAAILSSALMFDHLGERRIARDIEGAVEEVLASGKIPNLTTHSGVSTSRQTDMVLDELLRGKNLS